MKALVMAMLLCGILGAGAVARSGAELAAFSARAQDGRVFLKWNTVMESRNSGFDVQRERDSSLLWETIGFVPGAGTIEHPREYSFEDAMPNARIARYRLRQVDSEGNKLFSATLTVALAVADQANTLQIYPTDVSDVATVEISLAARDRVELQVYNSQGQQVLDITRNLPLERGNHVMMLSVASLEPGAYFLCCKTQRSFLARKFLHR